MEGKIYNNHLIYANTDYLEEPEIQDIIVDALIQADLKGDFFVNVVHFKEKKCKYSYIWVSTKEIHDFLIGFNEMGINSIKKIQTPSVSLSASTDSSSSTSASTAVTPSSKRKFSFIDDDDESVDLHKSGNIVVDKEIKLKRFTFSEERLAKIKDIDPDYDIQAVVVKFKPAGFVPIDDEEDDMRVHNVWIADNPPDFVNVHVLLPYLRRFVTDPTAKGKMGKGYVSYPHINIKKNERGTRIWVTFNPDSTDGQFALHMCKQLAVSDGKQTGKLYFKHYVDKHRDA